MGSPFEILSQVNMALAAIAADGLGDYADGMKSIHLMEWRVEPLKGNRSFHLVPDSHLAEHLAEHLGDSLIDIREGRKLYDRAVYNCTASSVAADHTTRMLGADF